MEILLFIILHWYLSLFAQSFFNHRYSAHQMFTMSKFMEKVFYIYCFIAQGSSYMSPYVYGAMHRMHHAFADTEKDPHSPKYSNNFIKLMIKTYHEFKGIQDKTIPIKEIKGSINKIDLGSPLRSNKYKTMPITNIDTPRPCAATSSNRSFG